MNVKNLTSIFLAFSILIAIPGVALAENGSSSNSGTGNTVAIACMKTAVGAREASLKSAYGTFSTAMSSAYAVRETALSTAWSKSSWSEIKPAIRAAWKDFKDARKTAKRTWHASKKESWKKFKTDAKACRAPSDINDSSNSSEDE